MLKPCNNFCEKDIDRSSYVTGGDRGGSSGRASDLRPKDPRFRIQKTENLIHPIEGNYNGISHTKEPHQEYKNNL